MDFKKVSFGFLIWGLVSGIWAQNTSVGTPQGTLSVSDMGAAVYNLSIDVPDGGPMTPKIGITYNSQMSGYGLAGYGMNITGISCITRGGRDLFHDGALGGVTYTSDDNLFLDGKRLILKSGVAGLEGAVYTVEGNPYTEVTEHNTLQSLGSVFFITGSWYEVKDMAGMVYQYGHTDDSKLDLSNNSSFSCVAAWYINQADDRYGNYISYQYQISNYLVKPLCISYGYNSQRNRNLLCTISFAYQSLGNNSQSFVIKDKQGTADVCLSSITTSINNQIHREYTFSYDGTSDQTSRKYSRLVSVTEGNGAGEQFPPVTFDWNFLPSQTITESLINVSTDESDRFVTELDKSFFAMDLNGDGVSDIIRIAPVSVKRGNENILDYFTDIYIYRSIISQSGDVSYYQTPIRHRIDATFTTKDYFISSGYGGMLVMDFDGDGANDLVIPHNVLSGNMNREFFYVIYGRKDNATGSIFVYPLLMQTTNTEPLFTSCDMNGDGRDEVICLEKSKSNGLYPGYVIKFNVRATGTVQDTLKFSANLSHTPKHLVSGDFNNDGLQDLLIVHEAGYKIYFNTGGTEQNVRFSEAHSLAVADVFQNHYFLEQGDFNGDGLVDFIYNRGGHSQFYIATNLGNGTFSVSSPITMNVAPNVSNTCVKVIDINHDGYSDVMITNSDHNTQWMLSNGETLTSVNLIHSGRNPRHVLTGDFDGDGYVEIANYGRSLLSTSGTSGEDHLNVYKAGGDLSQIGKIAAVTDGFGNQTSITYNCLTNPNVYTADNTTDAYPVHTYTVPLSVVSQVTSDNGANSPVTTDYTYRNLKAHVRGRGLLGFEGVEIFNHTLNTTESTEITAWNETRWIPEEVSSTVELGNNTSETTSIFTVTEFPAFNNYFSYVSQKEETDYDGNIILTQTQYDTEKGVINNVTVTSDNGTMLKSESYPSYIKKSGIWLPDTVVVSQKHKDDASVYSHVTAFVYDQKGNIISTTSFAGTDIALTTVNTYDIYGNVLSSAASGNGVTSVTKLYDYDPSGLHVIRTSTNPSSSVYQYTYDNFGNVLTETDATNASNLLTTTHTYDDWDRRISSVTPTGIQSATQTGWGSSDSWKYYVTETCDGRPAVTTWYDKAGRETFSQSAGLKGITVSKTTAYNDKGAVASTVSTNGSLSLTQNMTYDERGRLLTETSSSGKTVSYSYGNRSVTTTVGGQAYTKNFDAWGNVIKSTDPVSHVTYFYSSNGKPKQILSNNKSVYLEYDEAGNKTRLTDPDAGTMTYTYAADGTILSQTDGKGIQTVNTYDSLGRLTSSQIGQKVISYQYGNDGNEKMKLTRKSMDGNQIEYAHDAYGRVISETRTVAGQGTYSFTYAYNSTDQLSSTTYPGGLTEVYQYDSNGFKTGITANSMSVYNVESYDGKVRTESFLGQLRTVYTCNDNGYETSRLVRRNNVIVDRVLMSYDVNTGNLLSRQRNDNPAETFTYDNLNRLLTVTVSGTETMGMGYSSSGNIVSKSGVGNYYYQSSKPHAVTHIYNTPLATNESLRTAFNDLGKISLITDTLADGSYRTMSFQYGPERERWYSELTDDGVTSRSTVYAGNYEKVTENGVTREFYYLDGNVIVVKQNGVFTPYLAFTDNLGSVLSIMDEDGLAVFKAEYDAWGKPTVNPNLIGFHRGYTGHEMLPEFDLINMNGRLYDPMIGRFLSPDNYVQEPDNSQNFNRYSYCLNNPLKYRDENGEFFIGFLSGFFRGAFQGQNPFIAGWNAGVNELKISWGLFELDSHKNFWGKTWEFLSRFTWQLPQTLIGFGYAQTSNLAWQVDNVGYWGGATVLSGNNWGSGNSAAMTIGNYITGGSDLQPDPNNSIFQHEYGHYLQSQAMGWAYLTRVAIPSLLSAGKKDRSHKFQPFEQDANRRAFNYFNENVDGFYQTEEQFSDNLDKGIKLGWDFYSNPLDVTHQGIRGTYYDYHDPQHRALIANLSLSAKWYDYAGWFEGIVGVFGVGIGNGIYYNNNRIIKK